MLAICSGMDAVTLQPVAGAQGEFTAVRYVQEISAIVEKPKEPR